MLEIQIMAVNSIKTNKLFSSFGKFPKELPNLVKNLLSHGVTLRVSLKFRLKLKIRLSREEKLEDKNHQSRYHRLTSLVYCLCKVYYLFLSLSYLGAELI